MIILSDSVLVELKPTRDNQLESVFQEDAQSILAKVKAFYFAVWKRIETPTTQQVANSYQEVAL